MGSSDDETDASSEHESVSEPESPVRTDGKTATSWFENALRNGLKDSNEPAFLTSPFEAYFAQSGRAARTSTDVFSQLVPALTPEEFNTQISSLQIPPETTAGRLALEESHVTYFSAYLNELLSGFNILFYGFGSKRSSLNKLGMYCAKKGHVVVANAFFPDFTLKDLLSSMEKIIDAPDIANAGSGIEAQCRRILSNFSHKPASRHLFVVIHNIDATALRSSKAKACLATLASHPSIHIVASVDHIMAPMLWSVTDTFARSKGGNTDVESQKLPQAGFSWLWHDLTTMQPYDFELSYADRTSYSGASVAGQRSGGQANVPTAQGGMISESAAQHVLASVTSKAKKLFALLCQKQLAAIQAASGDAKVYVPSSAHVATSYELLFASARDEFIATNDTSMRALLGEFRDHGLVVSANAAEGGESLWIPLSKDVMAKLANTINIA